DDSGRPTASAAGRPGAGATTSGPSQVSRRTAGRLVRGKADSWRQPGKEKCSGPLLSFVSRKGPQQGPRETIQSVILPVEVTRVGRAVRARPRDDAGHNPSLSSRLSQR